jgi:hypothetical protein
MLGKYTPLSRKIAVKASQAANTILFYLDAIANPAARPAAIEATLLRIGGPSFAQEVLEGMRKRIERRYLPREALRDSLSVCLADRALNRSIKYAGLGDAAEGVSRALEIAETVREVAETAEELIGTAVSIGKTVSGMVNRNTPQDQPTAANQELQQAEQAHQPEIRLIRRLVAPRTATTAGQVYYGAPGGPPLPARHPRYQPDLDFSAEEPTPLPDVSTSSALPEEGLPDWLVPAAVIATAVLGYKYLKK